MAETLQMFNYKQNEESWRENAAIYAQYVQWAREAVLNGRIQQAASNLSVAAYHAHIVRGEINISA